MSNPLAVYLSDHLAASHAAINLLDFVSGQHEGEPLGRFAADMIIEIESDREVLDGLIQRVGAKQTATLKAAVAWVSEKATRVKLRRHSSGGTGTLLALESLALGILGKRALWRALDTIAANDPRLASPDYDRLIIRAEAQHARVEEQRLRVASTVLTDEDA